MSGRSIWGRYNREPSMRMRYRSELSDEIDRMIEDGELDPDDADAYYTEKMDDWDGGYADMMYDIYKDRECGYD